MADSSITKAALANALKALMQTESFDKISIAQICEKCEMNRKSFYYHFRDKYDLLNWIFDSEFFRFASKYGKLTVYDDQIAFLEDMCRYFYERRDFYRKALAIEGQNSFAEHLRIYIRPLIEARLQKLSGTRDIDDFYLDIFTDVEVSALKRWLLSENCMPPEEVVAKIDDLIRGLVDTVTRLISDETAPDKQNGSA